MGSYKLKGYFIINYYFFLSFSTSAFYLDQILFTSVVDMMCEDEEGNGDDDITMSELVTDEDEILKVSRMKCFYGQYVIFSELNILKKFYHRSTISSRL